MTITEFLLARIADDEAAARDYLRTYPAEDGAALHEMSAARVLAECEAKRRIVRFLVPLAAAEVDDQRDASQVLRILASVYDDHEDYRDEWRP